MQGYMGGLRVCLPGEMWGKNDRDAGCRKLSYKVKFDLFDSEQRFLGLRRIQFHASLNDPTQGMREKLTYGLFREMGVPAPRQAWSDVQLVIKGAERSTEHVLGLHLLTEFIDQDFTKASFPGGGKGNLFREGGWPGLTDEAYYLTTLQTNKAAKNAAGRMLAFSRALNAATDDFALVEVVEEFMDVDAIASYLAVDRASNNWDGPLSFRWSHEENNGFYNHSESWFRKGVGCVWGVGCGVRNLLCVGLCATF